MSRVRQPSRRLLAMFHAYLRWYVPRHMHSVRGANLARFVPGDGVPTIVCLNHAGWWDPLICMLLEQHAWRGKLTAYAPMDSAALKQYGFFSRLGLFPVDLNSAAGARRFLCDARGILAQPGTSLWITPQGRFRDVRERPLHFRSGLGSLLTRTPQCRVLPVAMEYPYWEERLPEALINCGRPLDISDGPARTSAEWTRTLEQQMETTQDELAALAVARDPAPFTELLRGAAGVNSAYDAMRRTNAALHGEAYQAEHGTIRPSQGR